MNANQIKSLEGTSFTHVVIAQYSTGKYQQGEIISRHTSQEAAERGVRRAKAHSSFLAVRRISDYA